MTPPNPASNPGPDSQAILNDIFIEFMKEKKSKRRWRMVTRILFILLLTGILFNVFWSSRDKGGGDKPHIGLVNLKGTIFDGQPASSANFSVSMNSAYKNKGLKAVILRINSPGGSPVQADYMYNAVQRYRKAYPKVKVYAVCTDICASAAYYIAAAADDIYANESSLVGSIGVLYNGFGFVDTLQKVGVTRRLQTAGVNKGFLDPFSPEQPAQTLLLQGMLDDIHQQFIAKVKLGRGARLKVDDQTFSGLFWTGTQAKERGLIDGFASSGQLARDVIKLDKIIDYTYKETVLERLSKQIGTAMANQLPLALGLKPGIIA